MMRLMSKGSVSTPGAILSAPMGIEEKRDVTIADTASALQDIEATGHMSSGSVVLVPRYTGERMHIIERSCKTAALKGITGIAMIRIRITEAAQIEMLDHILLLTEADQSIGEATVEVIWEHMVSCMGVHHQQTSLVVRHSTN